MTICWGKRRAVPPTTTITSRGNVVHIHLFCTFSETKRSHKHPSDDCLHPRKKKKSFCEGFMSFLWSKVSRTSSRPASNMSVPAAWGLLHISRLGFEFSGSKGHILCGSGMTWYQRIVCIKPSGLTRRMLTYNPRGTSLTSSPSSAVKLNVSKSEKHTTNKK